MPSSVPLSQTSMCSLTGKLLNPFLWILMEASLPRHDWWKCWWLNSIFSPSPFLGAVGGDGVGPKVPTLESQGWPHWQSAPILVSIFKTKSKPKPWSLTSGDLECKRHISYEWNQAHMWMYSLSRPLFFFFPSFLDPHVWHIEIPRLGVELELQSPVHATATAMQDPSQVCDLRCSSRQRWMLNPLSEARDQTRILMDTSHVRYHWATTGTPSECILCVSLTLPVLRRTLSLAALPRHWETFYFL